MILFLLTFLDICYIIIYIKKGQKMKNNNIVNLSETVYEDDFQKIHNQMIKSINKLEKEKNNSFKINQTALKLINKLYYYMNKKKFQEILETIDKINIVKKECEKANFDNPNFYINLLKKEFNSHFYQNIPLFGDYKTSSQKEYNGLISFYFNSLTNINIQVIKISNELVVENFNLNVNDNNIEITFKEKNQSNFIKFEDYYQLLNKIVSIYRNFLLKILLQMNDFHFTNLNKEYEDLINKIVKVNNIVKEC